MRRYLSGLALALVASHAFAQSQPIPGGIGYNGEPASTLGAGILVAPAGGGAGRGVVVAPDRPFPVYMAAPPAAVAGLAPVVSASSASTSLIAKASAGNYFDGYCQSTALGRCILYNSTTVPAAGALTPALVLECAVVTAGGQGGWQYSSPRRATVGMVMLYSSSADCNTYTVSSTAYIHASVQ